MRKVKIVCTLGPATAGVDKLVELIEAGMDVARLNFSHGDYDFHRKTYQDVRTAAAKVGKPVAILADLSGPKIRVDKMKDSLPVMLVKGAKIVLTTDPVPGTAERVSHSYKPLAQDVRVGDPILLDDGLLRLKVVEIKGNDVLCVVMEGGPLKDKKGMNLPGTKLSTPALTEKDKKDIVFGRELGVDYFALSFVRSAKDVMEAKALAGDTPVIAKLEKPEAIDHLEEILDVSDGAMVARGDLGVEAGHEKVPVIQKRILRAITPRAKPAITATQMLESMISNPVPTRAEVSDVANAVLDGTDAVMLSGETSVGKFPIEAVKTLVGVINEVEASIFQTEAIAGRAAVPNGSFSHAIADAATAIAKESNLAAIAVYSESGFSAQLVSANRPRAAVICFSRHDKVLQRLALCWGVLPLHGAWVEGIKGVVEQAEKSLLAHKLVKPGDDIAITFGMVIAGEKFQTNVLKLWKVRG
ncbi:MAG TPA: pyruvate kinase [Myxococcales bacterium]|jgi:pyruvate kinase